MMSLPSFHSTEYPCSSTANASRRRRRSRRRSRRSRSRRRSRRRSSRAGAHGVVLAARCWHPTHTLTSESRPSQCAQRAGGGGSAPPPGGVSRTCNPTHPKWQATLLRISAVPDTVCKATRHMALSGGAIAGIVIGSIALAAVVIVMGEAAVNGGGLRAYWSMHELRCKVAPPPPPFRPVPPPLGRPLCAHVCNTQSSEFQTPRPSPSLRSVLAALCGDQAAGAGGAAGGRCDAQ